LQFSLFTLISGQFLVYFIFSVLCTKSEYSPIQATEKEKREGKKNKVEEEGIQN
jgi:hypothetical protein